MEINSLVNNGLLVVIAGLLWRIHTRLTIVETLILSRYPNAKGIVDAGATD